ncbi:MAG TPA: flagellar cap protein FliD N-terminal domain-containing protein, partial [Spirochaetia bacterium]|nr:flagellar cap protein FliD N-terminal domain-containing protein [Spirochaetia bacterium]
MPDTTSIPGVTSKYDTQKLIEELMKVERIPRDRAEARLKQLQLQRTVWLDINRRFIDLREKARNLFSFQNPFNERIAKSSNEQALTATATRQALNETHLISIKQIATADRFMSDRLSKDFTISPGIYTFGVGDKTVELNFQGG